MGILKSIGVRQIKSEKIIKFEVKSKWGYSIEILNKNVHDC